MSSGSSLAFQRLSRDALKSILGVKLEVARYIHWKAGLLPEAIRIICAPSGPDRGAKAGIPRALLPPVTKCEKCENRQTRICRDRRWKAGPTSGPTPPAGGGGACNARPQVRRRHCARGDSADSDSCGTAVPALPRRARAVGGGGRLMWPSPTAAAAQRMNGGAVLHCARPAAAVGAAPPPRGRRLRLLELVVWGRRFSIWPVPPDPPGGRAHTS
eukprot:gene13140-biopygen17002